MLAGFLVAVEIAARHYELPGPLTTAVRELVFPPKSGALPYAGLALMVVVLTWRERFLAFGAAIGIDLVILVIRWAAGISTGEGHPYGNGALWMLLAHGVLALTRRTGAERVLLLKGVGLGLLLVVGRKLGDTWLLITSATRPQVLDQYVATADHALGQPSWYAGRIVDATGAFGFNLLDFVYGQLAVAAVLVSLYQLRHVAAERRFPTHHLVRSFLVIGMLGPGIYMIYPVVGPIFAYGSGTEYWESVSIWADTYSSTQWAVAELWPQTVPAIGTPQHMPFDEITPRNCMPSLHTAWAAAIFIHTRRAPRPMRWGGTFWLLATLAATLGFGYHYGADLVAGVVFVVTIEVALRAYDRGWDRAGVGLVVHGTAVFAALLLAYRYLPLELARYPWVSGPLLILAMLSVVYGYMRYTNDRMPDRSSTPTPKSRPEPAPEPA